MQALSNTILTSREYSLGKFIGEIKAWCEAAMCGVKNMSLSELFVPEDYAFLLPEAEKYAERCGVHLYLEKTFLTTDLWPKIDTAGKWVFVIYKAQKNIDDYLTLKAQYDMLVNKGIYIGTVRKEVSQKMGLLLGYPLEYVTTILSRN